MVINYWRGFFSLHLSQHLAMDRSWSRTHSLTADYASCAWSWVCLMNFIQVQLHVGITAWYPFWSTKLFCFQMIPSPRWVFHFLSVPACLINETHAQILRAITACPQNTLRYVRGTFLKFWSCSWKFTPCRTVEFSRPWFLWTLRIIVGL